MLVIGREKMKVERAVLEHDALEPARRVGAPRVAVDEIADGGQQDQQQAQHRARGAPQLRQRLRVGQHGRGGRGHALENEE